MPLPSKPLASDSIELAGEQVAYHSMSRADVIDGFLPVRTDLSKAELFVLVHGTTYTEDEIVEWRKRTDSDTVGELVDAILRISGLAQPDPEDPESKRKTSSSSSSGS